MSDSDDYLIPNPEKQLEGKKKKKGIKVIHKNTDKEEAYYLKRHKKNPKLQYDPQDKYYLNDLLKEGEDYEPRVYQTHEEAYNAAKEFFLPYISRVCRKISSSKMLICFKISAEERFCFKGGVSPLGNYCHYGDGKFWIGYRESTKDKNEIQVNDIYMMRYPIFKFIFNNSDIRSQKVICEPYHSDDPKHNPDFFNVFPGFKAKYIFQKCSCKVDEECSCENEEETEKECYVRCAGICKPILKHLWEVWAQKDRHYYNYILEWFFHLMRELDKTDTMLFIIGPQGIGKTMVYDFIREYVLGDDLCLIVCGLSTLTEGFNALLIGRILVIVDETATVGTERGKSRVDAEKVKNLITGKTSIFTRKGQDSIVLKAITSFAAAANHEDVMLLEEKQRRAAMFMSLLIKYELKYYTDLAQKKFPKMGNAFYTMARLSKCLTVLKDIPQTEVLLNCIKSSKSMSSEFFNEVFKEGEYPIPTKIVKDIRNKDGSVMVYLKTMSLFEEYLKWHLKTNNGVKISKITFAKQLKQEDGLEQSKRMIDGDEGSYYRVSPSLFTSIIVKQSIFQDSNESTMTLEEYIKSPKKVNLLNPDESKSSVDTTSFPSHTDKVSTPIKVIKKKKIRVIVKKTTKDVEITS